jgi:transposase-like protein
MAERREFLNESDGNKGSGFRFGRSYGQGRVLEFRVPRDRYGNFHPTILTTIEPCSQYQNGYPIAKLNVAFFLTSFLLPSQ